MKIWAKIAVVSATVLVASTFGFNQDSFAVKKSRVVTNTTATITTTTATTQAVKKYPEFVSLIVDCVRVMDTQVPNTMREEIIKRFGQSFTIKVRDWCIPAGEVEIVGNDGSTKFSVVLNGETKSVLNTSFPNKLADKVIEILGQNPEQMIHVMETKALRDMSNAKFIMIHTDELKAKHQPSAEQKMDGKTEVNEAAVVQSEVKPQITVKVKSNVSKESRGKVHVKKEDASVQVLSSDNSLVTRQNASKPEVEASVSADVKETDVARAEPCLELDIDCVLDDELTKVNSKSNR